MLFLQLPSEVAAQDLADLLPIDDTTALALERALLSTDESSRFCELSTALANNQNAASWALRTAETRLCRTINHVDEAAPWLCGHLETELADALTSDATDSAVNDIGWRLPLLATKLAETERRLSDFERRLEHEKLESLKELAYGASHEINNPLANIAARAQTLLEDEAAPERQRKLLAIHRQAMRAHEMIADLMLFARPPKLNRTTCNLNDSARTVVDELNELAAEGNVELDISPASERIFVSADTTQLGVAMGAVVKNALEAAGNGGHVLIATRSNQDWAEIIVSDDGPGISEEVRRHLFDPFFSGREAGRGLGFGLSKCWRIVTDHGGQVVVAQRRIGAEITIRLPITTQSAGE